MLADTGDMTEGGDVPRLSKDAKRVGGESRLHHVAGARNPTGSNPAGSSEVLNTPAPNLTALVWADLHVIGWQREPEGTCMTWIDDQGHKRYVRGPVDMTLAEAIQQAMEGE